MKNYISIVIAALIFPLFVFAQNEENQTQEKVYKINPLIKTTNKLERDAFESSELINCQTDNSYKKNTLGFVMNHRFGLVNSNSTDFDLIGIWGPANIRLALEYAIYDWVKIGFGTTKDNRLQDFNLKLVVLKQTQNNKLPLNISYYGNFTNDARSKENFFYTEDRYSFFNQIIFSRRFTRSLSFMVSPSVSHFNIVEYDENNDTYAVSMGARYKISPQTAITAEYNQPFDVKNKIKPGVSIGLEISTGSHAFQVFITNYRSINPQFDIVNNQNDFFNGDFMIGFNINRLWNL